VAGVARTGEAGLGLVRLGKAGETIWGMIMDTAEITVHARDETAPSDPIALDMFIDWRLRRIAQERAEIARNTAVAQAEIARYQQWLEDANSSHHATIAWLESQLREVARVYDFHGKKSRKLPHGTIGFRQQGGRTTILNMEAAIAFAREHAIPVKVTETVSTTAIKEYIESTGETLPFVEVEPKVDAFYVKIAE
jgi:hypothetical protein